MHSLPSISDFTEFLNHNLKAAKNSASLGAKYGGILASSVFFKNSKSNRNFLGIVYFLTYEFLERKG